MSIYKIYLKTKNGLLEASDFYRDFKQAQNDCEVYNYFHPDLSYVVCELVDYRIVEI